jgi:hypothetical protein
MIRLPTINALLPALALVLFTGATIGVSAVAFADEPPPPATTPTPETGRHHNPAFATCKKQADDQKLAAGAARRDFMKNCMKSAAAPPSA